MTKSNTKVEKTLRHFRDERIKNKPWRKVERLFYKGNYMRFNHCNHDILDIEPNILKIYRSGTDDQPFYSWLVCSICDKGELFSDRSMEEKFTINPQSIITKLPEIGISLKDNEDRPFFDSIQEVIDYLSLSPLKESKKLLAKFLKKSDNQKLKFIKNEIDDFITELFFINSSRHDLMLFLKQSKNH